MVAELPQQPTAMARYHVWARALWAALDLAELHGLHAEEALEGLPFNRQTLRQRRLVDWDDYCVATERLEQLCGTPQACQDLLASAYHRVLPEFRGLAGGLISPLRFAHFALGWLSPRVYQGCAFQVYDLGQNQLQVELALRPAARPSLTFFRATIGELRALPQHLGLAPAQVQATFSDRHGSYCLELPASASLGARARDVARELRAVLDRVPGGSPLAVAAEQQAQCAAGSRVRAATQILGLTPRQVSVLHPLVLGASNKEIAQQLGCAENTVELHVSKLLSKAQVQSRTRLMALVWSGFE